MSFPSSQRASRTPEYRVADHTGPHGRDVDAGYGGGGFECRIGFARRGRGERGARRRNDRRRA
jgi:hypothetical protein